MRILLKNVGTEPRDLVIGNEGPPDLYGVDFMARSPDQQELPVLDSTAMSAFNGPVPVRFQPGGIRKFLYPLSQLFCVVNRQDVPFRTLLEQGYTVRALLDLSFVRLTTPDFALHQ